MFFLLSKTVGLLFRPLVLVMIPLIASFLVKSEKIRRVLQLAAAGLLFIFSNEFITNEVVGLYEAPLVPLEKMDRTYEWGIVLTGVTDANMPLNDRVYLASSPERVVHAAMLYRHGIIRKILISGGSSDLVPDGTPYREAVELRKVLVMTGIPDSVLMTEENSRNTWENAVESARVLRGVPSSDCLLITSAYHIPRASACFRRVGMDCDVFPTDSRFRKRSFAPDRLLIPSPRSIQIWEHLLKEWVGRVAYAMAGYTA